MHDFRDETQKPALKIAILTLPSHIFPKEQQGATQNPAFTLDYTPTTYLKDGGLQNQRQL